MQDELSLYQAILKRLELQVEILIQIRKEIALLREQIEKREEEKHAGLNYDIESRKSSRSISYELGQFKKEK